MTNGDGSEDDTEECSGAERWRIQSTEDNRRIRTEDMEMSLMSLTAVELGKR